MMNTKKPMQQQRSKYKKAEISENLIAIIVIFLLIIIALTIGFSKLSFFKQVLGF